MTFSEAKRYLLERAQSMKVDLEILASESRELTLEAFEGSLSELTQATRGGIGLRVIANGSTGYAYSEERSAEALDWALSEAKENAELQESTGATLPVGQALGSKDLLSEGLSASVEEKAARVLELESTLRADPRLKQIMLARYMEQETSVSIASSGGADGSYRDGFAAVFSSFVLGESESLKQGWDMDFSKEFHALEPGKTALRMLEKTGRLLGAQALKTGRYNAYFEPKAFAQLLWIFSSLFSGKSVMEGKSRLGNKLGQRVAAENVTLIDDPTLPQGLASHPFDSEGSPARPVTLIENGVLKSFLHNSETARALGQENNAHASRAYSGTLGVSPSNLYLKPGAGLTPQSGVIITNMSGLHAGANPITGDLSLQGLGLMVEGSEVSYPVENFALSGNILEILINIRGLGGELEWQPFGAAFGSPLVEVGELSFAGA